MAGASGAALADAWARWRWHLARERERGFPPSPPAGAAEEGCASPAGAALAGVAPCLWHWRALAQAAGRTSARPRAGPLVPCWLQWRTVAARASTGDATPGPRAAQRSPWGGLGGGGSAELREQARAAEARDTLSRAWQRWLLPVRHRKDLRGGAPGSHPHDFGAVGLQMLTRSPLQFCFELWRDNAQTVSLLVNFSPRPARHGYPPPPPSRIVPGRFPCPDRHLSWDWRSRRADPPSPSPSYPPSSSLR